MLKMISKFVLFLVILAGITGCDLLFAVNGVVTNNITGDPVCGVSIDFGVSDQNKNKSISNPFGEYSVSVVTGGKNPEGVISVTAQGYERFYRKLKHNDVNGKEYPLNISPATDWVADDVPKIPIPDEAFRSCISKQPGCSQEIVKLDCSRAGIKSLEGVANLPNLTELSLKNNSL